MSEITNFKSYEELKLIAIEDLKVSEFGDLPVKEVNKLIKEIEEAYNKNKAFSEPISFFGVPFILSVLITLSIELLLSLEISLIMTVTLQGIILISVLSFVGLILSYLLVYYTNRQKFFSKKKELILQSYINFLNNQ